MANPLSAPGAPGSPAPSSSPSSSGDSSKKLLLIGGGLLAALLVIGGLAVALSGGGDDDGDITFNDAGATTTAPAGSDTTASTGDTTTEETATGDTTTEETAPPTTGDNGTCTIIGLNSIDALDVQLDFTGPGTEVASVATDFAVISDGVRIADSSSYHNAVSPGEVISMQASTYDELPAGTTADQVTCEIINVEAYSFTETLPAAPTDTCTFKELDFADDMQFNASLTSPTTAVADLTAYMGIYVNGVRIAEAQSYSESIRPGEQIATDVDSFTNAPSGVDVSQVECRVLGFSAYEN